MFSNTFLYYDSEVEELKKLLLIIGAVMTFFKLNRMKAREFYNKRIKENNDIGSIQLMEEYAKSVIEANFCDGSPSEFKECSVKQLETIHHKVNNLVDWVNE